MLSERSEPQGSGTEAPRRGPVGGPVDGRSARRQRGRAAAVQAVVELFDTGELRPSADEVCRRAGVSSASLFRYFRTLDELYRAAFDEQIARATALARMEDLSDLSTSERIERFVAGRLDVYEVTVGVGRMARARAVDHADIDRALGRARARWLRQVLIVFRPELDRVDPAEVPSRAAAIDAVASFEAWDLLVGARAVSRHEVERSWTTAIAALLAAL